MEEKRDGVINKMLVLEFDRLKLKNGLIEEGEKVYNIKRVKVGESNKAVILGKMKKNDCMCQMVFEKGYSE